MEDSIRKIIRENGRDPDTLIRERVEQDDRTVEELVDDARESPGKEIRTQVRALYTTLEIVNKNRRDLTKGRDWYVEKGIEIWDIERRDELEAFQREYLRLLHNYSASVHSLIEHVYTILDRYEDEKPELKQGYFDEISSRDLGTKVDLLKQIRHYTQKRELPPVAASMSSQRIEEGEGHETEFRLILNKEQMMDWDGWDSDVRERLETWDDEIDITKLAEDYQSELNEFFEWFRMFLLRVFYEEIESHVVTLASLEQKSQSTRSTE